MEKKTQGHIIDDVSESGGRSEPVVYVLRSDSGQMTAIDQADLLGLWRTLVSAKWLIIGTTLACVVLAIAYVLMAEKWYRAEAVLVPTSNRSAQGLSGPLGNLGALGGLASLAGASLGSANTAEPLAVLKSNDFTREFVKDQNLLPVLFPDEWDAKASRWKPEKEKDWRDAVRYIERSIRTVDEDKKTGLITVAIEWPDPVVASNWANLLVERVNDRMRRRALAEAEANVTYLRQELVATNVITLQQSISRLLESELQKLMLARGNTEFVFRFVDRATPPKWVSRPKRGRIIGVAALGGCVFSIFIVFARKAIRRSAQGQTATQPGSGAVPSATRSPQS